MIPSETHKSPIRAAVSMELVVHAQKSDKRRTKSRFVDSCVGKRPKISREEMQNECALYRANYKLNERHRF